MNFLAFSGLLNFLTSISLGSFVLIKNFKAAQNRSYFAFNFTIAIYSVGYYYWQQSPTIEQASFWFRILTTGIISINLVYVYFVLNLLGIAKEKRSILIWCTLINLFFLWLNFHSALYDTFSSRFNMGFWPTPKFLFHLYLLFWHWSCFYGFYWLIKGERENTGLKKQQIKLVAIACGIGYLGGATNWPMWYGINFPPYPNIAISLYVGMIAYAILRHKLMDFSLIIRWGLAYFLLVLFFTLIFTLFLFLSEQFSKHYLHINSGFLSLFLICLLVLIFDPIRKKITRFVDQIIFRSPDFQSIISGIEQILKQTQDIRILSDNLSVKLKDIWNASHVGFVIWDYRNSHFQLLPKEAFSNQIISRLNETIRKTDFLVRTLETERRLFWQGIVIEDEVVNFSHKSFPGEKTTFMKIRRTMNWLGAAACVPLLWENELIGFVVLGKKRNNGIYNDEDKKFLSHVSQLVSSTLKKLMSVDSVAFA